MGGQVVVTCGRSTRSPTANVVRNDTINGVTCRVSLHSAQQMTRADTEVQSLVIPARTLHELFGV